MTNFLIAWFFMGLCLAPLTYALTLGYWEKNNNIDFDRPLDHAIIGGVMTFLAFPLFVLALHFTGYGVYGMRWSWSEEDKN